MGKEIKATVEEVATVVEAVATEVETGFSNNITVTTALMSDGKEKGIVFNIIAGEGRSRLEFENKTVKELKSVVLAIISNGIIAVNEGKHLHKYLLTLLREKLDGEAHLMLGWKNSNGYVELKVNNTYYKNNNQLEIVKSVYSGNLDLATKGDLSENLKTLNELVKDNTHLAIVTAVGASGFISQALSLQGVSDINIYLNLAGSTSTGKTTASRLPLSMFGNSQNMFNSFLDTSNRINQKLVDQGIVPFIIDDVLVSNKAKSSKKFEVISSIMVFSTGQDKQRWRDKSVNRFYCPVISSTEESVASFISGTNSQGTFYRFIELDIDKDTLFKSIGNVHKMEYLTSNNYGLIADEFAKALISKYNTQDILRLYEEEKLLVTAKAGKELTINIHRIANRIAVISLTARLLRDLLKIELDVGAIIDLLIRSMDKAYVKGNLTMQIRKSIMEFLGTNKKLVGDLQNYNHNTHAAALGDVDENENVIVYITRPKLVEHVLSKFISSTGGVATERELMLFSDLPYTECASCS